MSARWEIGDVDRVDVVNRRGADVTFDLEWRDQNNVAVPIAAATGTITNDGVEILSLNPYLSIGVGANTHIVFCVVDRAILDALVRGRFPYRINARSLVGGEDITLAWGLWKELE